jgi:hypothetical protein
LELFALCNLKVGIVTKQTGFSYYGVATHNLLDALGLDTFQTDLGVLLQVKLQHLTPIQELSYVQT